MISSILFMAIVPLSLLLVLAFTLLSGRMSDEMRKRVELGLTLIVYPVFIVYWAWQAWENRQQAEWLGFSLYLGLTCLFAVQFVLALRSRSLFPRFRSPKA